MPHSPARITAATIIGLFTTFSVAQAAPAQLAGGLEPPGAGLSVPTPLVQTPEEALAEDAGEYARRNGVGLDEAVRRLRAQEESVRFTDRLGKTLKDRLAGISIEHSPEYRIVVLLTGSEPVPDQSLFAAGMTVPVIFHTGAAATHDQVVSAMWQHRDAIRAAAPKSQGMGFDPRTGELVLLVRSAGSGLLAPAELEGQLEALTGVPVRVRVLDSEDTNLGIGGGSRVEGISLEDGRRYACTTGFVVTDGTQTGVVTAAHCPDTLTYFDPEGGEVPLSFVGGWGARYQDVQVHVAPQPLKPQFYADARKRALRNVTTRRRRTSTRAGDAVCHRGETTGYSCSEVELTDYAPPGELCGGPCDPVWVTVTGPSCRGGDSGGPIFHGTVAFGIAKGGNYSRSGRCNFYYYMSTDYLPEGWSLSTVGAVQARRRNGD
ncbi:MAG: S1 family peptidase [Pseudomonadota bacterium]|nr:S1 family peptidase [Pseudomonadota bacterium]